MHTLTLLLTRLSELSFNATSPRKPSLTLTPPKSTWIWALQRPLCFFCRMNLSNEGHPVRFCSLWGRKPRPTCPSPHPRGCLAFTRYILCRWRVQDHVHGDEPGQSGESAVTEQWAAELQMAQRKPLNPTWAWPGRGWEPPAARSGCLLWKGDDLAHFQVQRVSRGRTGPQSRSWWAELWPILEISMMSDSCVSPPPPL